MSKTFIGKVCNDFFNMPWDKIVAGLITGLLIYIGAARLFIIQDKLYDTNLKIGQQKLELSEKYSDIEYRLNSRIESLLLETNSIEIRINKNIRLEFKTLDRYIDDIKDKMNDLDKRISIIETKLIIEPKYIQKMKVEDTLEKFTSIFDMNEYIENKMKYYQCPEINNELLTG